MKDPIKTTVSKTKRCGLSKLKIFLLALSFAYLAKAMAGTYTKSMVTQLERQFNIPASLVGVIDGSFEMGNLLVIAFVSYFGAKFHRPRIIAAGCFIMGLGGFLTALPHLLMGRYQYERAVISSTNSSSDISLCRINESQSNAPVEKSEECKNEAAESLMWVYVLMGNILRGIGETPVAPLGLSYLDDHAKMENSALYIAFSQAVSILGPLFGSLLASFCAQLYVDIGSVNLADVTLALNDTRWVGAWWLGFLICGVVNILAAIPFLFMPKSLPKEGEEGEPEMLDTDNRQSENEAQMKEQGITKDFLTVLRSLFCNPIYTLFLLVTVIQFNVFTGFVTYEPKYLEQQFGKSASEAIFLIGVYCIPVICVGYFLGGLMMKKFKLSTYRAAQIAFVISVVEFGILFLLFAISCKNSTVAGITISYEGTEQLSYLDNLYSSCNANCSCSTNVWDPVCGDNGVSYVSACLAGCDSSIGTGKALELNNCSCVAASGFPLINGSAVPGLCPREEACDTMLLYYLILSLLTCLFFSFGAMPGYMVLIRSLNPEEKPLGLGIHLLFSRALAGIPAPIYFGAMIDRTCLKWGTTSCGDPGACRLYDSDAFRFFILAVPAMLRAVSYIPCIFILIILKRQFQRGEDTTKPNKDIALLAKGITTNSVNVDEVQELNKLPDELENIS